MRPEVRVLPDPPPGGEVGSGKVANTRTRNNNPLDDCAHTLETAQRCSCAVFFENMDVASVLDEMLSEMCREAKAGASTGGR